MKLKSVHEVIFMVKITDFDFFLKLKNDLMDMNWDFFVGYGVHYGVSYLDSGMIQDFNWSEKRRILDFQLLVTVKTFGPKITILEAWGIF